MGRLLAIIFGALTVALIAVGTVHGSKTTHASTPDGAVQAMFDNAKGHDWHGAYAFVAPSSNVDRMASPAIWLDATAACARTRNLIPSIPVCCMNLKMKPPSALKSSMQPLWALLLKRGT